MPINPTYPGVYIEEVPSGVRTIIGVATSITAFVGRALRGESNKPIRIQSFAEFERSFGDLWSESAMGYAIRQYFLNGGTDAIIVRVVDEYAETAAAALGDVGIEAASEGTWGNRIKVTIDLETDPTLTDDFAFNVTIEELESDDPEAETVATEEFRNVSTDPTSTRYAPSVLNNQSVLVRIELANTSFVPSASDTMLVDGNDGYSPTYVDYAGSQDDKTGIYALEDADLFNLLCIPPRTREESDGDQDSRKTLYAEALAYCKERRAMLIVDPPVSWRDPASVIANEDRVDLPRDKNAAVFFPRIKAADPLQENRLTEFVPCGVVAGIFARTDVARGVWKAPAGLDATLAGVHALTYRLTDGENGQLNPLGINCLRTFPVIGNVVWGARTLRGADQLASEWKYIPVRRLALYIEESLYRGTQWVVFEPNDEPLWSQIRLNVGAFMHNLFRQGAFQGSSPRDAYFVKCDKDTTTQNDIDRGIVNILVGFAPLKPAEFVIIKISQIAGQIET